MNQIRKSRYIKSGILAVFVLASLVIGLKLISKPKAAVYSEPINAQYLIDEVSTMHEGGVLPYHPGGWPWADKSNPHVDDNRERQFGPLGLPGGHNKLITWAYLVPEEGLSASLNGAVEITEIGLAYLSKSTGKWTYMDSGNDITWGGLATSWSSYAGNNFAGSFNGSSGEGGGKVTGVGFGEWQDPTWHLHFTGEYESITDSTDVKETISWMKARLVLRNSGGADDRAQTKYVLQVGTDYKTSEDMPCPCPSDSIGKAKYVTNDWRTFISSTMSPQTVQELAAANNLPPVPGVGSSPTSAPTATPTPTTTPTSTPTRNPDVAKYDIQPNGVIDGADLSIVIRDYTRPGNQPALNSPADFDNNGKVDLIDLSNLIKRWGQ